VLLLDVNVTLAVHRADHPHHPSKWTAPGGRSTTLKSGAKEQAPGTLGAIQQQLAPEFGPNWIEENQ
jgi:hypothetical protein